MFRAAAGLVTVAACLLASASGATTYSDPRGDAGSAPDLVGLEAKAAEGVLTVRVRVAGMPALAADAEVFLPVDVDRGRGTGDQHGVDVVYSIRSGGAELRTRRWNGAAHATFSSSASASYEDGVATFIVPLAELRSTGTIGIGAVGVLGADSDAAPDNGSWAFRLGGVSNVATIAARFAPTSPAAGHVFALRRLTATFSDGTTRRLAAKCTARLGGRVLGSRGCRWTLPGEARGKQLVVVVRAISGGGDKARTYRFRVR